MVEAEHRDIDAEEWSDVSARPLNEMRRRTKLSHRAEDAVLSVGAKAVHLEETHSQARPSVEAELRDMDAEERSDVSSRSLNERRLLG